MQARKSSRNLVVVSGYYGFDNLGDEAILEQLLSELQQLVPADHIRVLSHSPSATQKRYQVPSVSRFNLPELSQLLSQARLFISGGGGLFQDTRSLGSVLYYGGQIALSRLLGSKTLIYAQGLGPLKSSLSQHLTRLAFAQAQCISVRDRVSADLLASWGLKAHLTADPVWCLQPSALPDALCNLSSDQKQPLIGISLRQSPYFTPQHFAQLHQALRLTLPATCRLLLLPLQAQQDKLLLKQFAKEMDAYGFPCILPDTESLDKPSQWLNLIKQCDFVIGMRLHALIMALKSGIACVGIAYDPKVSQLLIDFEQPSLNLTNEQSQVQWSNTLKSAFEQRAQLSERALSKAEIAKNLACQNFNLLARILNA